MKKVIAILNMGSERERTVEIQWSSREWYDHVETTDRDGWVRFYHYGKLVRQKNGTTKHKMIDGKIVHS